MRGSTARRLRQIARALNLNPKTTYTSGGKLRRRPAVRGQFDEQGRPLLGPPIPRPGVMNECFRRAYKEAKKLYKGLPPSSCVPEAESKEQPFHARVVDSMRTYVEQTRI